MKKALFVLITVFSISASAATIKDGRVNWVNKIIELDVEYGGGCGDHQFSIEPGRCFESYPGQCFAKLIHITNDTCEALIFKRLEFPLSQFRFARGGAYLTIYGDRNSSVTVKLP